MVGMPVVKHHVCSTVWHGGAIQFYKLWGGSGVRVGVVVL
jgi:hypothetical protein